MLQRICVSFRAIFNASESEIPRPRTQMNNTCYVVNNTTTCIKVGHHVPHMTHACSLMHLTCRHNTSALHCIKLSASRRGDVTELTETGVFKVVPPSSPSAVWLTQIITLQTPFSPPPPKPQPPRRAKDVGPAPLRDVPLAFPSPGTWPSSSPKAHQFLERGR